MLDVKEQIVAALRQATNKDIYYELIVDSSAEIPCITYLENMNNDHKVGSTIGYSNLGFTIKVWSYSMDELMGIAQQIDNKMRTLGFKRESSNELKVNDLICKVLIYTNLGKEDFD